jgi:hypothetical protein
MVTWQRARAIEDRAMIDGVEGLAGKHEPFVMDREQRDRILAILATLAAQISALPFDAQTSSMRRSVSEMQACLSTERYRA